MSFHFLVFEQTLKMDSLSVCVSQEGKTIKCSGSRVFSNEIALRKQELAIQIAS